MGKTLNDHHTSYQVSSCSNGMKRYSKLQSCLLVKILFLPTHLQSNKAAAIWHCRFSEKTFRSFEILIAQLQRIIIFLEGLHFLFCFALISQGIAAICGVHRLQFGFQRSKALMGAVGPLHRARVMELWTADPDGSSSPWERVSC